MGYIKHHAIVVVAWDHEAAIAACFKAKELEMCTSDVSVSQTNGYFSFMILPDGSKEGWERSKEGDAQRTAYIEWLRTQSGLDWAEVVLDVDGDRAFVARHKWKKGVDDV
jgi:hypothetical protein